ncbi:type II secretion system F family protein, partial [Escherichia coli]
LCINKLLLHSENADNALMMSNYADKWLEEAKGKVKSTGVWITVVSALIVFAFIVMMITALYDVSNVLQH